MDAIVRRMPGWGRMSRCFRHLLQALAREARTTASTLVFAICALHVVPGFAQREASVRAASATLRAGPSSRPASSSAVAEITGRSSSTATSSVSSSSKGDGWDAPSVMMQGATLLLTLAVFGLIQWRQAKLNEFNAQVGAFKQLRDSFAGLRPSLPKDFCRLHELPDSEEGMWALQRYWHQSFDEWFITQKLHPKTLGSLWTGYYREALLNAMNSDAMVAALLLAQEGGACRVDHEFVTVVMRLKHQDSNADQDQKLLKLERKHGAETRDFTRAKRLQDDWKRRLEQDGAAKSESAAAPPPG